MADNFENMDVITPGFESDATKDYAQTREIERIARQFLYENCGVDIRYDFYLNTLFLRYVNALCGTMGMMAHDRAVESGDFTSSVRVDIHYHDLFRVYLSDRENDDAEKEGNVIPEFEVDQNFPINVEGLKDIFDIYRLNSGKEVLRYRMEPKMDAIGKIIEDKTAKLVNSNKNVIVSKDAVPYMTIFIVFLVASIQYTITDMVNTDSRRKNLVLEGLDIYVKAKGKYPTQSYSINIQPGVDAKLDAKHDMSTEGKDI